MQKGTNIIKLFYISLISTFFILIGGYNVKAADLTNSIQSVTVNKENFDQPGQPIKVTYNWALPSEKHVKAGDTITINLPAGTNSHVGITPNPQTFYIYKPYHGKKESMAEITVSGQQVKMTFTKYAQLENMDRGSLTIAGVITVPSDQQGGTTQTITNWGLPSNVSTPTVKVKIPEMTPVPAPDLTPGISKMGREANSQAQWMITGVTPQAAGTVTINDILGSGQDFQPSDWEFGYTTKDGYRSQTYSLEEFEAAGLGTVTFNGDHMIVKLNGPALNDCQWMISYFTKVTNDYLPQYTNNATASYQEGQLGQTQGLTNKVMTLPDGPAVAKNNDQSSGNIEGDGSISFAKVDENGNTVNGAIFKLIDTDNKKVISNHIKDQDGMISISNLSNGNYLLEETTVPAGYEKAQPVHIKVTDNNAEAIDAPGNLIVDDHKTVSFSFKKVGKHNNGQLATLSGASFNLVNSNGKVVANSNTTTNNGIVSFNNLTLPNGKYLLNETMVPKGYKPITGLIVTVKDGIATLNGVSKGEVEDPLLMASSSSSSVISTSSKKSSSSVIPSKSNSSSMKSSSSKKSSSSAILSKSSSSSVRLSSEVVSNFSNISSLNESSSSLLSSANAIKSSNNTESLSSMIGSKSFSEGSISTMMNSSSNKEVTGNSSSLISLSSSNMTSSSTSANLSSQGLQPIMPTSSSVNITSYSKAESLISSNTTKNNLLNGNSNTSSLSKSSHSKTEQIIKSSSKKMENKNSKLPQTGENKGIMLVGGITLVIIGSGIILYKKQH